MVPKHTLDHSDRFYTLINGIADDHGCPRIDLHGAINAESGEWAKAMNPTSSATGLMQWMKPHWSGWGFTREKFAALTAEQQTEYVRRYLAPYKGKLRNAASVYTAIFLPAFVDRAHDLDYVLCARGAQLGWAYSANATFDRNGDGRITVGELLEAIKRNWAGPRCREILIRANLQYVASDWLKEPAANDLTTTLGVQRRLIDLGYDLGAAGADGIAGALTRAAVVAFQEKHGLDADGLAGPKTQAALASAV